MITRFFFPGNRLLDGLTQRRQQQGLVKMTRGATGTVNNFINQLLPPANRTKTHQQHGKALFVFNVDQTPLSSKTQDIQFVRDWNRNDKHRVLIDGQLQRLFGRQMTHAAALNLHFLLDNSARFK
ncbi:hypothetical protein AMECASPLE_031917 [Ameca splendens]|uniref:Uncharacterized protein n=1 Tax=Ameca splendens TaxID=208324 RepID=A0ABV0Z573_9TELE